MEEIWKDIPEYEGYYQVSNLGNIKSLERIILSSKGVKIPIKERILKKGSSGSGYKNAFLCKKDTQKTIVIHKLVTLAFLGERIIGMTVDHINGVKTDNRLENLEYVTHRENIHRYRKTKNRELPIGVIQSGIKFASYIIVSKNKYRLGAYNTIKEAVDIREIALADLDNIEKYAKRIKASIYGKNVRKERRGYRVEVSIKGKQIYFGTYPTVKEAQEVAQKIRDAKHLTK